MKYLTTALKKWSNTSEIKTDNVGGRDFRTFQLNSKIEAFIGFLNYVRDVFVPLEVTTIIVKPMDTWKGVGSSSKSMVLCIFQGSVVDGFPRTIAEQRRQHFKQRRETRQGRVFRKKTMLIPRAFFKIILKK